MESLVDASERGIGVRSWEGGRQGYAYGTDLGEAALGKLARASVANARAADPDEHAGPPGAGEPAEIGGLRDPAIGEWEAPALIDLALAVERAALERDDRVSGVEQAVYAGSDATVAFAGSGGARGSFAASQCYAYAQAMAGQRGGIETGLGFGIARSPVQLDAASIGAEAGAEAASMLGAAKPPSRTCPVVLDERVAASFASFIGGALCADAVQRGRSPFAGRLGEELASPAFVLADEGLEPEGPASAPFDGEGVARRRTSLIEGGRLAAYLHDSYTARREGTSSTGSAARGSYRSPPSVGPSNLIVAAGDRSREDLIRAAGDGVYVSEVAGLHSGVNPVSGVFSVGASGRLIRSGELADPVREFTIASDLVSMLGSVAAAAREVRWVPFGAAVRTPAVLISEMAIAGS